MWAHPNVAWRRDRTGSRLFLLRKKGEKLLAKLFPWWYLPLYAMVTFTRTPYAQAVARARRQNFTVCCALVMLLALLAIAMLRYLL